MMRTLPWLACLVLALTVSGAQEEELKDNAGKTVIRYVVEAPEGMAAAGTVDPGRQVGLILCFPEHDHATGDEILPVRESLRRLGLTDGYVLLAGHPQGQKFGIQDHEPIEKLIAWAKGRYPINPRRVYLYGKGEGGKVSAEFGMAHPKIVTAGITYSWGWWLMPSELTEPLDFEKGAPEFYMVLGMRDLATHIATVRDTYGRMKEKGYRTIYREFDDLGARTYHPVSNDDALAWATRLRNKVLPLSAGEEKLLQGPRVGPAGYFEGLALVGGAKAGGVLRGLMKSGDVAVRRAAVETCRHGIFDEETAGALVVAARDGDARVRRAAVGALGEYAGWRSGAAQKGLMELAAAGPDRVAAVDALGLAVRYQVKGVRQDPPVFAALVGLLTDKDEDVRGMAANILAPVRDADFRGDAGRAEKKAPEGGWQQWLDEIGKKEEGYRMDFRVCGQRDGTEAMTLFCEGGREMHRHPAVAFERMLKAADLGYVPAEAALGMMYADGQGVQQNYGEAGKWWGKAAAGGHVLAAANVARVPKGPAPVVKQ